MYKQSHADYYLHGNPANSLPVWLQRGGYRTGFVGKYINDYPLPEANTYIPPGWNIWYARYAASPDYDGEYGYSLNENGLTKTYGTGAANYATDVYRNKALSFITNSIAAGVPFFLELAVHAPHNPFVPAPRHATKFASVEPPRPLSFNEADVTDKPAYVQARSRFTNTTIAKLDSRYLNRLRMMLSVDEAIKRIIDLLTANNQIASTYIIFASDNGWVMGPHRLGGTKGVPYEESVRVPLLIRGPGVPAGVRLSHLVGNVDLAPTIAELAGVAIPADVDGRSLVPLLTKNRPSSASWRQAFPISFRESSAAPGVPSWQGVRTSRYTYAVYAGTGERELYDNVGDPNQLQNIAASADPALLAALSERTLALSSCAQAACRALEDQPLP
jgi:arylsulfatase A-like enzyme